MLVPFDQMSETSRIWIYQAERTLTREEVGFIKDVSSKFIDSWTAHGATLKASFAIRRDQFLILTIDEDFGQASGCSIDSSVHLVKAIEDRLGVSITNNGNVAFFVDEKVVTLPFNSIKKRVLEKKILPETKIFDNTIQNMADFKTKWLVDSKETWVNRFFN